MSESKKDLLAVARLRLGVLLIFLWWFPFWLILPTILSWFSATQSLATNPHLHVVIILIQTALGIVGMVIAGKPVAALVKAASFKKAPGIIWKILITGKAPETIKASSKT